MKTLAPRPAAERASHYRTDHLPEPTRRIDAPPWDEGFAAELAYYQKVAQRYIANGDSFGPSVSSWFVLAVARELATLRSQNEALRQIRAPVEVS